MSRAFRFHENQVASKLNYAHVGMYFIYRGAVSGSRGLMTLWLTASLMSLDMIPVNESFTPNRFLNDAFVSHPTEYTLDRHAKLERQLAWMTLRIRQRMDWHIAEDYDSMPRRPYIDIFYPIVADLSLRRDAILLGPRRVGKTVMIYHAIKRLIDSGVDSRRIIYMSIDTPIYSNVSLYELFLYARTSLHTEDVDGFFVFYDEIQYLKDWEVHLKSMVDTYRKTKFVASGSATAALKMKSNESGAGRFTDFMLPPLTFFEFLQLQKNGWLCHGS